MAHEAVHQAADSKHRQSERYHPKICVKNDENLRAFALPKPLNVKVGAVWMHLSPAAKVFLELITERSKDLGSTLNR